MDEQHSGRPETLVSPPEGAELFACPFCDYPKPQGVCPECGRESAAGRERGPGWGRVVGGAVVVGLTPAWMTAIELVGGKMYYRGLTSSLAPGDTQFNDAASTVSWMVEKWHLLFVPLLCVGMVLWLLGRCCQLQQRGAGWQVAVFLGLSLVLCMLTWLLGFAFVMVSFSPD